MEFVQFAIQKWYLFLALAVTIGLLLGDPLSRRMQGIRGVGPLEATRLLNHDSAVVIDVGDSGEFEAGHISGAINLPLKELPDSLKKLEKHRSKPFVVCCRSGNRSMRAAAILRKGGFEPVYNLEGGLNAWVRDNMPLEKG